MSGHEDYLEKIRQYDADADEAVVKKLYNRLRLVIQNRDASTVACSDMSELETIRDGFCKKTLGLDANHDDGAILGWLKNVCDEMKGDGSNKHRMVFYYLVAKKSGTLDKI